MLIVDVVALSLMGAVVIYALKQVFMPDQQPVVILRNFGNEPVVTGGTVNYTKQGVPIFSEGPSTSDGKGEKKS